MRKPVRHHIERGEPIRLQTFLARSGLSSRRGAEEMIAHGRVAVNGETVTTPGVKIVPGSDRVDVDGEEVKVAPTTWVALHKPKGYVTSRIDPYGRPTVYDLLPEQFHGLFHVGRLDRDSEGLLLLTNDGALANRFLHPSFAIDKEYDVIATGKPSDAVLHALQDGIELEDGISRAESAKLLGPAGNGLSRLKLVLREGKKREVRRMLEAVGHPVKRLVRRRFGPVDLAELPEGKWRVVAPEELSSVRDATPERRRPSGRTRGDDGEFRLDPERPLASFGKPAGKAGPRARPSRGKDARDESRPPRRGEHPSRGDKRPVRGEGRPARGEDRPHPEETRPARPPRGGDGPSKGAKRPPRGEGRPTRGDDRPSRGERPERGEKRPSRGEDRPPRGDDRPSRGEKRPARGDDRPTRGDDRPSRGNRPARGDDRPTRGDDRPSRGEKRTARGDDRPTRGDDRPSRGEKRPTRGDDRPTRGEDRPSRGNRPARGEDRPTRGEDRPSRANRPARGEDRPTRGDDRPSRGEKRPARGEDRPTRGEDRPTRGEKRPARGEDRPTRGDDRPARGNRPAHGDDRPPRKPSGGPKRPGGGRGPARGGGRKPGGSGGPRGR